MGTKLYRYAVLTGMLGLLLISVVMILEMACPDIMPFQMPRPFGLLLKFVYALQCIFLIKREVKSKNYLYVILYFVLLFFVGITFFMDIVEAVVM